jgi:hypothetical protein
MADHTLDPDAPSYVDRRGFLRAGGFTVALAAILAACGEANNGEGPERVAQAGTAPPLAEPPSGKVTDDVLLRTLSSIHYNILDAIAAVVDLGVMTPEFTAAAENYAAILPLQATVLADATTGIGGNAFNEANPVVARRIIEPALALIAVSPVQGEDCAYFIQGLATWAAATHQSFTPSLSVPSLRGTAMSVGSVHARVATGLAYIISPENVVTEDQVTLAAPPPAVTATTVDAGLPTTVASGETTTTVGGIPEFLPVYQVPTAFGAMSPVEIILGKPGAERPLTRRVFAVDTPSLNSLMYDD